jgi:hypothetical protein
VPPDRPECADTEDALNIKTNFWLTMDAVIITAILALVILAVTLFFK